MAILFTLSSIASIFAYLLRKKKNSWGVPKVPAQFNVGKGIVVLLIFLSIFFPLFGISVMFIILFEQIKKRSTLNG